LKKVLTFFLLWHVIATIYLADFYRGVEGDVLGDDQYVPLSEVFKSRRLGDPVYGEPSRPFRIAREKYTIEYLEYAEFYADRGQWNEFSAPGVPIASNNLVASYVKMFQTTKRSDFTLWLRRAGKYLPLTRRILIENGLPGELAYLAMVESGFDQHAISEAKAAGLWQFMPETARRYGLRVDAWVDDRLDMEKSTIAASKFLLDLYARYQSWNLAIAAYNAGERRVSDITRRAGSKKFWELVERRRFSIETRYHVIKFHAAVTIMRDLDGYGFFDVGLEAPLLFERVDVSPGTSLEDIADILGISAIKIFELNPQLIHHKTPPDEAVYSLRVPVGMAAVVREGTHARPIS